MRFTDIFKIKQFKQEIEHLKNINQNLQNENTDITHKLSDIGAFDYYQIQEKISNLSHEYETKKHDLEQQLKSDIASLDKEISQRNASMQKLEEQISESSEKYQSIQKSLLSSTRKLNRTKELYKAIEYSLNTYLELEPAEAQIKLSYRDAEDLDNISPSIYLKLHCMDIKELRKAYRSNDKQINQVLDKYSSRYTTKANRSIYQLMVIALRAELQNILYNLKYEKLDKSISLVQDMTQKYLKIAGEGNQSIAGTLTKFIGEIEYLFINAVKIEYNYYVKKEQARQEQLAIKEQMRQEAEERKALEAEKKRVEKEELKYQAEIDKLQNNISSTTDSGEITRLQARILELQAQLSDVIIKKEEIANLQNGKAGNVYIISNLGSFGEDVFKIGMTRRLDPQDRINELGNASVPFKFDVHSFIFSDDAVGLEKKLHDTLNSKRLNKVNLRKEFFRISINELEDLVTSIDPTAEFNKTMLAEEFFQSMSSEEVYSSDYTFEEDEGE